MYVLIMLVASFLTSSCNQKKVVYKVVKDSQENKVENSLNNQAQHNQEQDKVKKIEEWNLDHHKVKVFSVQSNEKDEKSTSLTFDENDFFEDKNFLLHLTKNGLRKSLIQNIFKPYISNVKFQNLKMNESIEMTLSTPRKVSLIKSLSKNFSLFKCHHRKSKVA